MGLPNLRFGLTCASCVWSVQRVGDLRGGGPQLPPNWALAQSELSSVPIRLAGQEILQCIS